MSKEFEESLLLLVFAEVVEVVEVVDFCIGVEK